MELIQLILLSREDLPQARGLLWLRVVERAERDLRLSGDRCVDVSILRSEQLRSQMLLMLTQQIVRLHHEISWVETRQRHSLLHHRVLLEVILLQLRLRRYWKGERIGGVMLALNQRRRTKVQALLVENLLNVRRLWLAIAWDADWIILRTETRGPQRWIVVGCEVGLLASVGILEGVVVEVLAYLVVVSLEWRMTKESIQST